MRAMHREGIGIFQEKAQISGLQPEPWMPDDPGGGRKCSNGERTAFLMLSFVKQVTKGHGFSATKNNGNLTFVN